MVPPAEPRTSLHSLPEVRRLVLIGTLAFSSFFLTLSSLPLYAISGGAPEGQAGLVTTVMLAATVGTQILVPTLARRFGLATVMAAGLVTLGGAAPLYLISQDLWWLLVVSAIRGTGFAVITVLMPLVGSAMVAPERRGEVIGLYGLSIAAPNLVGVPIGVALVNGGNFGWVAILAAAPLLALPLVRKFAHGDTSAEPQVQNTSTATTIKSLTGITLVLLTVTISGAGILTFVPIIAWNGTLATAALLIFGLTAAVSRWRSGLLSDRIGTTRLLPISLGVATLGMAVVGLGLATHASATLLIGITVMGIGYGAVQNLSLLIAFTRAGPKRQAMASSIWNASFDAGTAIGALLVGLVATAGAGYPWTFIGCALLMLMTTPLAVRSTRPSTAKQKP